MAENNDTITADVSSSPAMLRMVTAYWLSRAIYVAATLGIPDLLKNEAHDFEELANATGSHAPSLGCCARWRALEF